MNISVDEMKKQIQMQVRDCKIITCTKNKYSKDTRKEKYFDKTSD